MSLEDFALPEFNGKRYSNPSCFKNWKGIPGLWDLLKWKTSETDRSQVLNETIPIHFMKTFESHSDLFATWLGHATVLVSLEGAKFITDPVWAERASPVSFTGPKRYRPPPMNIENVPQLDFAVISHDHYDHLDIDAVKTLTSRFPNMRWFVPKGMSSWMENIDIKNTKDAPDRVTEMNWGESTVVSIRGVDFTVWCLPAQHWGQRGPFDRNVRLWSGWMVTGRKKKFYYTGDTGMCDDEFRKIGEKFGPIDLAAIPIGCFEPHWVMTSQHIGPTEAVEIHKLIKSKFSIGIHWGTYSMGSYEPYLEPKLLLDECVSKDPQIHNKFVTINQGTIWSDEMG